MRLGVGAVRQAQHRLPAIYPYRSFVTAGGLLSYGPDLTSQYKQAVASLDLAGIAHVEGAYLHANRRSERTVAAFAQGSNTGLIVVSSSGATSRRNLIIALAARHRLPAYNFRFWADAGGLILYGPDTIDLFRRAAGYVGANRPYRAADG